MDKVDIELLFEQAGLKNHRGARLALFISQATGDNELLEEFTKLAMTKMAMNPDVLPFVSAAPDALDESGLSLGTNICANNVSGPGIYLPAEALHRHPHILVAGESGSGKSWYIVYLCRQAIQAGEVVWFFDSEGDFSDLIALVDAGQLWVIRHDQLRINPLEPLPGEDPLVTLGRVKTVLRETSFMREGSLNLMSEMVHKLYTDYGILNGGENYPCLEDIYQEVKRSPIRKDSLRGRHAETLLSRLINILENMRPTYLCRKGFPIDVLAAHSIVFDITGLSRDLAHFFVNDLILRLADWKLRELRCGS